MSGNKRTHREVPNPQITARYLAEYMSASARRQRSILRDSKYQPIAPLPQHTDAKRIVSSWYEDKNVNLYQESINLRNSPSSSNFERSMKENNADYVTRFASVCGNISLPSTNIQAFRDSRKSVVVFGVKVNVEINLILERYTRSNVLKTGVGVLRYSKGSNLGQSEAHWHSAFLYEYWKNTIPNGVSVIKQLCIVIDAHSGMHYSAPGDSRRRFLDMEAACKTIRDQWSNVQKPRQAILA